MNAERRTLPPLPPPLLPPLLWVLARLLKSSNSGVPPPVLVLPPPALPRLDPPAPLRRCRRRAAEDGRWPRDLERPEAHRDFLLASCKKKGKQYVSIWEIDLCANYFTGTLGELATGTSRLLVLL